MVIFFLAESCVPRNSRHYIFWPSFFLHWLTFVTFATFVKSLRSPLLSEYQKWLFEAAWAISFWPGPRPKWKHPGQDMLDQVLAYTDLYGEIFIAESCVSSHSKHYIFWPWFFLGLGLALDLHCSLGELSEIPPTASDPPGPFHFGLGPGSKLLS